MTQDQAWTKRAGARWTGSKSTHVFSSLRAPVVEALTCAKTSGLLILSASRCKLAFDQAGVMDRKTQGPELSVSPSSRSVGYQPTPKPSALIELSWRGSKGVSRVVKVARSAGLTQRRGGVENLKPG